MPNNYLVAFALLAASSLHVSASKPATQPDQDIEVCNVDGLGCHTESPLLGGPPLCQNIQKYGATIGQGPFNIKGNALSCKLFSDPNCVDAIYSQTSGKRGDAASGWESAPGWPKWSWLTNKGGHGTSTFVYAAYACKVILNNQVVVPTGAV